MAELFIFWCNINCGTRNLEIAIRFDGSCCIQAVMSASGGNSVDSDALDAVLEDCLRDIGVEDEEPYAAAEPRQEQEASGAAPASARPAEERSVGASSVPYAYRRGNAPEYSLVDITPPICEHGAPKLCASTTRQSVPDSSHAASDFSSSKAAAVSHAYAPMCIEAGADATSPQAAPLVTEAIEMQQ